MTAALMRFVLALAIVLFVAALLYIVATVDLSQSMRDLTMVIVGVIVAKFGEVYSFYFGSSDGSKIKTDMLSPKGPLDLSGAEIE